MYETTPGMPACAAAFANPIASSMVELVALDGATLQVRGLDCLDGTPLIDLKPERAGTTE